MAWSSGEEVLTGRKEVMVGVSGGRGCDVKGLFEKFRRGEKHS
jgi:hypothetical protein